MGGGEKACLDVSSYNPHTLDSETPGGSTVAGGRRREREGEEREGGEREDI